MNDPNPNPLDPRPVRDDPEELCESPAASRREFFDRSKQALAALALSSPMWLPKRSQAVTAGGNGDIMVYIFLRGGMDGMSLVVPYGDPDYYNLRPTLSLPPPGSGTSGDAIDLDGYFGLSPIAAKLLTPYNDGALAFIPAAGSTNDTRSHFDAMKYMEFGNPDQNTLSDRSGYLGRYMAAKGGAANLRGMSVEYTLPYALYESPGTIPVPDPANFPFPGNANTLDLRRSKIENMYGATSDPLKTAGESGLATIDLLDTIDFENYQTSNGAEYGESFIGQRLRKVAAMVKASVGVETYSLDVNGWDTHDTQGNLSGTYADLMGGLSEALEAFYLDMQSYLDGITLCVITEFGRTASENGSSGTDHGRASTTMVMGGNVQGGQIHGTWPTLAPPQLDLGDLAVTTDYRDVMWEILSKRMGATDLASVFPNHTFMDPHIIS